MHVGAVLAELVGARRALLGRTVVNFNELMRIAMILMNTFRISSDGLQIPKNASISRDFSLSIQFHDDIRNIFGKFHLIFRRIFTDPSQAS